MMSLQGKKIAIVHDWLVTYAGAERVLEQIIALFPQADVFSVIDFLPEAQRGFLQGKQPVTTALQRMPGVSKRYRSMIPFMPLVVEQLDLTGYDIILSSSHAVAKGVITTPDSLHLAYIHSPMRYAWDLQHQYLREAGREKGVRGWVMRYLLHRLRQWDTLSATRADVMLANSQYIARRIAKSWGRQAQVVYPPVDTQWYALQTHKSACYVTASRLVPYKRVDLIVRAFMRMPDKELIVIGDGPQFAELKALAANHANITLLGYQDAERLRHYLQQARAFIFAAEEDFGITPVEAQACGTPVIAYGRGGALETIVEGKTGLFFAEQSVESLMDAVKRFESLPGLSPQDCRDQAENFSIAAFRQAFLSQVICAHERFCQS